MIKINISRNCKRYSANRRHTKLITNNIQKVLYENYTIFSSIGGFSSSCLRWKPTAPESPDPDAYGKTIQPFHQIPSGDQEGGGKARSTEEKSSY